MNIKTQDTTSHAEQSLAKAAKQQQNTVTLQSALENSHKNKGEKRNPSNR